MTLPAPIFLPTTVMLALATGYACGFVESAGLRVAASMGGSRVQAVASGENLSGLVVAAVEVARAWGGAGAEEGGPDDGDDKGWVAAGAGIAFGSVAATCLLAAGNAVWIRREAKEGCGVDRTLHRIASIMSRPSEPREEMRAVLMDAWLPLGCLFVTAMQTLAVFPGLIAAVEPLSPTAPSLFAPISFLVFNAFAWLGAAAPAFWAPDERKIDDFLLRWTTARFLLIPSFLFCNVVFRDSELNPLPKSVPTLISSDNLYLAILAIFSLSHGYLTCLCMVRVPQKAAAADPAVDIDDAVAVVDAGAGGSVVALAYSVGCWSGTAAGFVLRFVCLSFAAADRQSPGLTLARGI
ncbi:nucleoside transporter-domain-containing protein [Blyttiomyces helicus]|uniref:Nucleoside transporter-domain-containing protein n=1 Tax=Blyttiomyces helicus TaxID=388810 RepID=A0A4P9W0E2_9FUNG|nr:nucleoside transporter-domain-containing protein [Blyttiomyces helicus]|eukprot:RKO84785.1 nucleoside transporter-domain-containing protein [Blyttiomyces helicus]